MTMIGWMFWWIVMKMVTMVGLGYSKTTQGAQSEKFDNFVGKAGTNPTISGEIKDDGRTRPKGGVWWLLTASLRIMQTIRDLLGFCSVGWKRTQACMRRTTDLTWLGNKKALRQKQLDDPEIGPVLLWVEKGKRPFGQEVCQKGPATRHYWNLWSCLVIHGG